MRPLRPYSPRRLALVTAALIATLGLVTGAMLYASYQDALREQQLTLRHVAIAISAQTAGVAEGVETEGQLAALREMACDEYQGFLFSRPVEHEEVPALLARAG